LKKQFDDVYWRLPKTKDLSHVHLNGIALSVLDERVLGWSTFSGFRLPSITTVWFSEITKEEG